MRSGNVRLGNVKLQRSFSEADKARHLQLHLLGPDGNTTEHQQLRWSRLEDNRFGMYQVEEGLLLGLAALRSIASGMIRLERILISAYSLRKEAFKS